MYSQSRWSFILLFFLVFSSCATLEGFKTDAKSTYNKVAGKDVSKEENEDQPPAVYYVAVEGLKLYPEPRFSKKDITDLPWNEKVLRYKLSKGFAYIKVVRTGNMGWVENSCLSWKRVERETLPLEKEMPAENIPDQNISEPDAVKETSTQQASPERPSLDHLGPGEVQAAPPPRPQQSQEAEEEKGEAKEPSPSIFDSF